MPPLAFSGSALRRWALTGAGLLVVSLAAASGWGCQGGYAPRPEPRAAAGPRRPQALVPAVLEQDARIPHGVAWVVFLERNWGFSPAAARATVTAARPVFNLARIQAGHRVSLWTSARAGPLRLRYAVDPGQELILSRPTPEGVWRAELRRLRLQSRVVGVSGILDHSLFAALEAAGEQDALALKFAQIFGWDLDFYTDPRSGDRFRMAVEKHYYHGRFVGYGRILAAEYINAGHPYQAVLFNDGEGAAAYFQPNGKPLRREFLRSPLKFVALRVTSGFSHDRFHPVLKLWRPHLGVDYGAPMGTPVQALGSGQVVFAGRHGEAGNMVQLRHARGYETLYLHLSKILVHLGERVRQGQTIGRVGMTGLATGPHLDFRITHFGVYENFQTLRRKLPPAAPVPAALHAAFAALCQRWLGALHRLAPRVDVVLSAPAPASAGG